jgi:gas vesicle protein
MKDTAVDIVVNVLLNGGVVVASLTITGYFLRKWINSTEETVKATALALAGVTERHGRDLANYTAHNREELAQTTRQTAEDIKNDLQRHRDEDEKCQDRIIGSIDKLTEQVKVANGRTTKNEIRIAEVAKAVEERTGKVIT